MNQEVPTHEDDQVPVWLAMLVLVLLMAVVGVGGYVVRGLLAPAKQTTAVEREIVRFEAAVQSAPDSVEPRLSLGYAYQRAGRLREALEQYDAVLQLQPTDPAALFNKGRIFIEQGRDREGEAALWSVLERDPTHVLAARELGEYYASKGEYRSLVYAVKPVVEAKESSADLQYLMGLAYENLGQIEWAEARYRLALTYYPDMPEAHEALDRIGVAE
jgi:tetratricopeptide (TPR) repeat protein